MNNSRKLVMVALAGAGVVLAVSWASGSFGAARDATAGQLARHDAGGVDRHGGGIARRSFDPSGIYESEHGFSLSRARVDAYVDALEQGTRDPIDLQFAADAARWTGTIAWLWGHWPGERPAHGERTCAKEHPVESPCELDFDLVIERVGETEGQIAHVRRGTATTDRADCHELMDCMTRDSWLGRRGPIPSGPGPMLAMSTRKTVATQTSRMSAGEEYRLAKRELDEAREQLRHMNDLLERIDEDHENYVHHALSQKLAEGLAQYWEWRLAQL